MNSEEDHRELEERSEEFAAKRIADAYFAPNPALVALRDKMLLQKAQLASIIPRRERAQLEAAKAAEKRAKLKRLVEQDGAARRAAQAKVRRKMQKDSRRRNRG